MREPTFTYNTKTCRYEPARPAAGSIFKKTFSILFASAIIFTSLAFVHNENFTSDKEVALLIENQKLEKYKSIISAQLNYTQSELGKLEQREADLRQALLFGPSSGSKPSANLQKASPNLQDKFKGVLESTNQLLIHANNDEANFGSLNLFTRTFHEMPTHLPVSFTSILSTAGFGTKKHPYHQANYQHQGIDFACAEGTIVLAAADGIIESVKKSELQAGEGNIVIIDHGNGYQTRYAHLGDILVRQGQQVKKGKNIAISGNTGASSMPHLHFEVLMDGHPVNPVYYLMQGLNSDEYSLLLKQVESQQTSMD